MAKISPLWRNMLLYIMSAIIITVLFSSGACVLYINRVLTRSAEAAFEDLSENLVLRLSQFFVETEQICTVLSRNNLLINAMLQTSENYSLEEQYDDYFVLKELISYNQGYEEIRELQLVFKHNAFYTHDQTHLLSLKDVTFIDALPQVPIWIADETAIRYLYPVLDYKYSPEPIGLIVLTLNENHLANMLQKTESFQNPAFSLLLDHVPVRHYGQKSQNFLKEKALSDQWTMVFTAAALQNSAGLKDALLTIAPWLASGIAITICIFASGAKKFYREIRTLAQDIACMDLWSHTRVEHRKYPELAAIVRQFNLLMEQLRRSLREEREREEKERTLSLQMLESQINPHFLYNSLDVINWLAYQQGADTVAELLRQLGAFYREALRGTDRLNSLKVELAHSGTYLNIMRYRVEGQIALRVENSVAEDVLIPRLSLQPLIENAVQHGIMMKADQSGQIVVRISEKDGHLLIDVLDDGPGMSEEQLGNLRAKLNAWPPEQMHGLINIHHRIQLLFGETYGLSLSDGAPEMRMQVRMILPRVAAKSHESNGS